MQVGQKLFYVPYEANRRTQSSPYEVEVTKVGRKWATVKNPENEWEVFRIDIETMCADGKQFTSPGTCYFSRELWVEATESLHYWNLFRNEVNGRMRPPKQLSLQDIKTLYNRAAMWSYP